MAERNESIRNAETNAAPEIEKSYAKLRDAAFASMEKVRNQAHLTPETGKAKTVLTGKFEYSDDGIWFRTYGSTGFRAVRKEDVSKDLLATDFIQRLNSEYLKESRERLGSLESIVSPIVKKAADRNGKFIVNKTVAPNNVELYSIDFESGNGIISNLSEAASTVMNPKSWKPEGGGLGPEKVMAIEFSYGINAHQLVGLLNDRLEQSRKPH